MEGVGEHGRALDLVGRRLTAGVTKVSTHGQHCACGHLLASYHVAPQPTLLANDSNINHGVLGIIGVKVRIAVEVSIAVYLRTDIDVYINHSSVSINPSSGSRSS